MLVGLAFFLCLVLFLLWRIDNPRVERIRMALVDRFVPTIDWSFGRANTFGRWVQDFQSYARVYQQNQELREELQRMKSWREAALQLEQQNARLRELNNVRLSPRLTYVTGEILADSGSPFRQSGLVNIGSRDGVVDGAAAMDGLGLVGRVSGTAASSSRILFMMDASSRVPAIIRPSGQRTMVAGDNSPFPALEFIENAEDVKAGDRVVTSGAAGVFPPDLLVGQVMRGADGRLRVLLAADYRRLRYIRVLRPQPSESVEPARDLLGPRLPPLVSVEPGLQGE